MGAYDKVRDEESLLGHFPSTKTGKKATVPGFLWTCIQAGLSACGALKFSSQAERDWKGRRDQ